MGTQLRNATGEHSISPWDALLLEVRRSSYRASWIDQRVETEAAKERELVHEADDDQRRGQAVELRRWLDQSRKERTHMAKIAKAAIDAGLSQRYVQSIEVEARTIARVLGKAIGALDLTREQQQLAADVLRSEMHVVAEELHERHNSGQLTRG